MPARKTAANGKADAPPRPRAVAPKQLKYGRPVVEAAVKMLEGILMFLPPFSRAAERNELGIPIRVLSEVEHDWLVDDWYEFGLSNVPFQNLILSLFGRAVYARLVTAHVGVVVPRLVAFETERLDAVNLERTKVGAEPVAHPLPLAQIGMVGSAAFMARMALGAQLEAIEQMADEQENVESGGARPGGGQDGEWQDFAPPLTPQAPHPRPDARDQGR